MNKQNANRFRPMLECCEDRTVPTVSVTVGTYANAAEGAASGVIRFVRTGIGSPLTVNYSVSGTATAGSDYTALSGTVTFGTFAGTADVFVTVTDDSTAEPTETVTVDVAPGTGYTIGASSSATVNISDNETPEVWLGVEDAGEDGDTGRFRFNRLGDLSGTLTVNFSVSGTATSGTDYTSIGTSVSFSAGASYTDKVVTAIDDIEYDPNESIFVTVTSGSGYTIGSPYTGTVYIEDDELTPVYWVGGSGASWSTASNWSNNAVPGENTAVYFHATYSDYDATLPSSPVELAELHLVGSYSGTVELANELTVGKLELTSGAISQPSTNEDFSVLGLFDWRGGMLNNTPSAATVNFYGGGRIILPGEEETLTTGSALNFASLGEEKLTTISGAGSLLLNGTSDDGIFVSAGGKVTLKQDPDGKTWIKNETAKTLTFLEGSGGWLYEGDGETELELRVINQGGQFALYQNGEGSLRVTLTGGDANTPSYINEDNVWAQLVITTGAILEATNGVRLMVVGFT